MKIRILSDLHLEFCDMDIPPLADDKETVLVLAGDIGVVATNNLKQRYIPFLQRCSEQFKAVIAIAGNHEYYHGHWNNVIAQLREAITFDNVYFLENETKVIDDVAFIGATLWTDCGGGEGLADATKYWRYMNDSKLISTDTGPLVVDQVVSTHHESVGYITTALSAARDSNQKTVVVVHHGVAPGSIHAKYLGGSTAALNVFFSSDLTHIWEKTSPTLIIHGHTHESVDYQVGNTRVLTNPRGYVTMHTPAGENQHFDPRLVVEV